MDGLTVGSKVGFKVGAAVGTALGCLVGATLGRRVEAMGSPLRHALLVCPPKAPET